MMCSFCGRLFFFCTAAAAAAAAMIASADAVSIWCWNDKNNFATAKWKSQTKQNTMAYLQIVYEMNKTNNNKKKLLMQCSVLFFLYYLLLWLQATGSV